MIFEIYNAIYTVGRIEIFPFILPLFGELGFIFAILNTALKKQVVIELILKVASTKSLILKRNYLGRRANNSFQQKPQSYIFFA